MEKIELGRNEACHCGSGLKYKKCCLVEDSERIMAKSRQLFLESLIGDDEAFEPQLKAFHSMFPEVVEKDNRVFWLSEEDKKTKEPYMIVEYYCVDKKCDCNRVILGVIDGENKSEGTILSVGYAFDRNDPDPGPYIDPLNPITKEGRSSFPFIENMLNTDKAYVKRLKQHYDMVKKQELRNAYI